MHLPLNQCSHMHTGNNESVPLNLTLIQFWSNDPQVNRIVISSKILCRLEERCFSQTEYPRSISTENTFSSTRIYISCDLDCPNRKMPPIMFLRIPSYLERPWNINDQRLYLLQGGVYICSFIGRRQNLSAADSSQDEAARFLRVCRVIDRETTE